MWVPLRSAFIIATFLVTFKPLMKKYWGEANTRNTSREKGRPEHKNVATIRLFFVVFLLSKSTISWRRIDVQKESVQNYCKITF
jgi:hypothetical protein